MNEVYVPVAEEDRVWKEECQTWKVWKMLSSPDRNQQWEGLLRLHKGGMGTTQNGRWVHEIIGGPFYKMYHSGTQGDAVNGYTPDGGHMHLLPGERALTFEAPRALTYMGTNKETGNPEPCLFMGVIALAIVPYPDFKIRTCGTFHLVKEERYAAQDQDYALCYSSLVELTKMGVEGFLRSMDQCQEVHLHGKASSSNGTDLVIQTQLTLEPVHEGPTVEEITEGEEVPQVVIPEVAPQNKLPQIIMAGPGNGPLANLQGHPARELAKKKRLVEISDWITEESRCREQLFQEKHMDMVSGKMKLRWSSRKIDLLEAYKNMIMSEEPKEQYEPMGVEMVKLLGSEEAEFQKEMKDHLEKKMEELFKAQEEVTSPVQQEVETNSVSTSWSHVAMEGLEHPAAAAAALTPLGQEGRQ